MRKLQGQTVSGMIVPHTTKDKYPTHSSEYGKGGHKEVTTLQDRDDIPEERLIDGTICYIKETDKEYQYKNKKWVEYTNINKEVIIQESDKLQQEINKLKDSKQDKGDYVVNSTLNQYAKKSDIPDIISQDLSNYAKKSDIPDTSNFAKKSDIPQEQDLSNYAKKSDIPDVSQFAKKSDIPQGQDLSKYATKEYVDSKTFSGGGKNYEVTDFSVTGNELHIKQNNGINKSVTLPTTGGSTPGKDGIDGDGIEQVYFNSNTSSLQGSILNYTFGYVNGDHSTQKILRDYAPTTDNYVPEQCTNYVVKPTVDLQYVYVSQRKKVFAEGSTTKKVWGEFEPLRLLYVYTKAEIDPSLVEQAIKSALEESAKLDEIIRQKLLDQFGIDKEALQKALQQIKDGQTELNNVQAEINKLKGKVDVNASSIDTLTNTVKNVGFNLDAVKAQLTQYVTSSDIDDKVAKAVRTTLDGLEPSWTTIVAELWPDKDLSKASQIKINSDNISALTERTTQTEHDVAALKLSTGDKSAAAELVAAVSDKQTGKVTAASIIAAVNNSSSEVTLKADKIQLDGKTIAKEIQAEDLELKGHVKATNAEIQGEIIATQFQSGLNDQNGIIVLSKAPIEKQFFRVKGQANTNKAYMYYDGRNMNIAIWDSQLEFWKKLNLNNLVRISEEESWEEKYFYQSKDNIGKNTDVMSLFLKHKTSSMNPNNFNQIKLYRYHSGDTGEQDNDRRYYSEPDTLHGDQLEQNSVLFDNLQSISQGMNTYVNKCTVMVMVQSGQQTFSLNLKGVYHSDTDQIDVYINEKFVLSTGQHEYDDIESLPLEAAIDIWDAIIKYQ